jgi:hypothetical protein
MGRVQRVEVLADLGDPAVANPEDTTVGVVVVSARRRRDALHALFQQRAKNTYKRDPCDRQWH